MKIIMSKNVVTHSGAVTQQVANLINPSVKLPDPMTSYEDLAIQAQPLKHIDIQVTPTDVSIEISDELIIAVLNVYGKIASTIDVLFAVAKPMFIALKGDIYDINKMAEETII